MARRRIKTAGLARLFNSVDRPVYVLDEQMVIRFCNAACCEWIGPDSRELIGQRCAYRTSPASDGPARPPAVADGLCPPPAVLSGQAVVGPVIVTDEKGAVQRRLARFLPIGSPGAKPLAIVAWVELHDSDAGGQSAAGTESLEPPEPTSKDLHERIRRFRRQAAGRYRIDRLLGRSPAMQIARARVELAVAGRANVLVVGTAGSGRKHTAHGVHYASDPTREGTLIPVDCAVLGAELIRSTVHALAANPLGDRAGRSTLLLSDADQLPHEVHADVAAVISADSFLLRVVSTSSVPLTSLAARGEYRPQLAALLSPIVIELPGLVERREDIPVLAQLLLEEVNAEQIKQLGGFSAEALDRLDGYQWPGNVDELALVVAQAHQSATGSEIESGDLPARLRHAAEAAAHPQREVESIQLDEFLGRIERELIERALAKAKGNKTKAADLLGLTRPRLYRRLVQLGLEEE